MPTLAVREHGANSHGAFDHCKTCAARRLSVCKAVPDDDLARLTSIAMVTEVAAGHGFIDEGERATCFFNVTRGTAKLFKLLPGGRRQITGFAGPGHFLGLAVSDTYAFSAEAVDHLHFCRFDRTALRALLIDYPGMAKRLLEVAANELVAAQEQMLLLGRKTARERLASFLGAQSFRRRMDNQGRRQCTLSMTRTDIADYLGLTTETVSRAFTTLHRDKLIDIVSQSQIVILDPAALEAIAGGMPWDIACDHAHTVGRTVREIGGATGGWRATN